MTPPESSAALVPITMGASGAATLELDDFLVTDAFFPPHGYLPPHVHERAFVRHHARGLVRHLDL